MSDDQNAKKKSDIYIRRSVKSCTNSTIWKLDYIDNFHQAKSIMNAAWVISDTLFFFKSYYLTAKDPVVLTGLYNIREVDKIPSSCDQVNRIVKVGTSLYLSLFL